MTFADFDRKAREVAERTGSGRSYRAASGAPLERRPRRERPGHRPGERPGARLVPVVVGLGVAAAVGVGWLVANSSHGPSRKRPATKPPAPGHEAAPVPAAPVPADDLGLAEAVPDPPRGPGLAEAIPPGTGEAELVERAALALVDLDASIYAVALTVPAGDRPRAWSWPGWLDEAAADDAVADLRVVARALGDDHPVAVAALAYAALVDEHVPRLRATVEAWAGPHPSRDATRAAVDEVVAAVAPASARLRAALAAAHPSPAAAPPSPAPAAGSPAAITWACAVPAASLMARSWRPAAPVRAERGGAHPTPGPSPADPPTYPEIQAAGLACLDAARALLSVDRATSDIITLGGWANQIGFALVEEGVWQSASPVNLAQEMAYLARTRRAVLRGQRPYRGGRGGAPFTP